MTRFEKFYIAYMLFGTGFVLGMTLMAYKYHGSHEWENCQFVGTSISGNPLMECK